MTELTDYGDVLVDEPAWLTFQPRPDQPERYDQQTAFYNSKTPGVAWMIGGNGAGCLGAEQEIYDPVLKASCRVDSIESIFHVLSRNDSGETVIAKASKPKVYGMEDLYRISISNGNQFTATLGHRVLTDLGWQEIGDIVPYLRQSKFPVSYDDIGRPFGKDNGQEFFGRIPKLYPSASMKAQHYGDSLSIPCTLSSRRNVYSKTEFGTSMHFSSEIALRRFFECESRSSHKPPSCSDSCLTDPHQCDEELQSAPDIAQEFSQQQAGVPEHNRSLLHAGVREISQERSRFYQGHVHLSRTRCVPSGHLGLEVQRPHALEPCSQSSGSDDIHGQDSCANTLASYPHQEYQRFPANSFCHWNTRFSFPGEAKGISGETYQSHSIGGNGEDAYITSIEFLRKDVYWDFSVEKTENYWMDGIWHHNTTSIALAKLAKFVLADQPPPRKDTPFWIISASYEMTMATAWKEKLYGQGHIPGSEVDWDRVRWYRPNQEWPYEVPLKPWPGRDNRNWTLVFKSYEQGRTQLQAQSIGGFCFIEQFPWGLLEEVLRGCREYNYPGSKFCEFTPVDPNMSVEIEQMLDEPETIPKGWEFYRANTECAMEAGHVDAGWFEEFFGAVPDEMRETRMTGAYASYEGQIYKTFNPAVHLVGDDPTDKQKACMFPDNNFPLNVQHRRGIDWGAGPANAFCCLWAYRNGLGQWYAYDEYYSTNQDYTTVDHLCEVIDQWPWPMNNANFGTTYADPSSPDNIRIAGKINQYTNGKYQGMSMMRGANAVLEGIEHVQWLLKPTVRKVDVDTGEVYMEPRLFIHKKNCPNLARQMRSYRWLKSNIKGNNPKDARREPLKLADHAPDALRYIMFSEAQQQHLTPTAEKREDRSRSHGVFMRRR